MEERESYITMDEINEGMELLHGTPILGIVSETNLVKENGEYKVVETVAWVKFATEFRREFLKKLKGAKLAVFMDICLHLNAKGAAFPGIDTIAEETGYQRNEVMSSIKEIESEMPYLLDVARTPGKANVYHPMFVSYGNSDPEVLENQSRKAQPVVVNDTTPVALTTTRSRTNKKEPYIPLAPKTPAVNSPDIVGETHASFLPGTSDKQAKASRFDCEFCGTRGVIQYLDEHCRACDAQVLWENNRWLEKRRKNAASQQAAAEKREARYANLLPGARYVMEQARTREERALAKAPGSSKVELQPSEIKTLAEYERTYGEVFIRGVVDSLSGYGRALMSHTVNRLPYAVEGKTSSRVVDRQTGFIPLS